MARSGVRIAVKARAWIPSQKEWSLAAQSIQPEEKERIGRFVFRKDAKSAMVGRLLIRRVVSSMLGIPFRSVRLARTDRGKPYVVHPEDGETPYMGCHFNISHQGDYVVIAADESRVVGVDIMKVEWPRKTSVKEFFSMMRRHLTDQEWSNVFRPDGDLEQLGVFFRFWCLKESVLKALGTGIGLEMSRMDFRTDGGDLSANTVTHTTTLTMHDVPAPNWLFEESMIEDHCIAVALQSSVLEESADSPQSAGVDSPAPFTVWSIDELLSGCEPLPGSEPDQAYWDNFVAKQEAPALS